MALPYFSILHVLLDKTSMLYQYGTTKYVNMGCCHQPSCPDFFSPSIIFLGVVPIILSLNQHLKSCPTNMHKKKRFQSF
jgi:hypothetical protein